MNNATIIAGLFVLAAALALSGSDTPAANNPAPSNDAALRAEIDRLASVNEQLTAELAAAKQGALPATAARPSPAQVTAVTGEVAAVAGCAGGNCAVPARVQAASEGPRFAPLRRARGVLFGRRR